MSSLSLLRTATKAGRRGSCSSSSASSSSLFRSSSSSATTTTTTTTALQEGRHPQPAGASGRGRQWGRVHSAAALPPLDAATWTAAAWRRNPRRRFYHHGATGDGGDPRTVYVNGEYVPASAAKVSAFDRGFLFGDAVYEVTAVLDGGRLVDYAGHAARLRRSLRELDMVHPFEGEEDELLQVHRDLVSLNGVDEGLVYLQVSRGAPPDREFLYPDPETTRPTVVAFTQKLDNLVDNPLARNGISVVTVDDLRWKRRDIKTTQLLHASMSKVLAKRAGCHDAWMVDEGGYVTEGTSNNAYIVKDGGTTIVTRPLSNDVLHGITRAAVLRLLRGGGDGGGDEGEGAPPLRLEERPFTVEEAKGEACEAFSTSASSFVMPVVEIDGVPVGGGGKVGPVTERLRRIYVDECLKTAV